MIYIYLIIIAIIITFLISHYINYIKINKDAGIDIQQTEQPTPAVIDKMMATKLPCIFMYEIELWDGFDLLIGYPYTCISDVFKGNTDLVTILKREYLNPFALPLTRDWAISLNNITNTWPTLTDKPTHERNFNHLIANFSGLLMLCIIHPNNAKLITTYDNTILPFPKYIEQQSAPTSSSTDTTQPTAPQTLNYLTIPLRPGHLLYIPYGWYYYIYCGLENSECVYMDLINKTWFSN